MWARYSSLILDYVQPSYEANASLQKHANITNNITKWMLKLDSSIDRRSECYSELGLDWR